MAWRGLVEGGGWVVLIMICDESFCLSICKEEKVSTKGRNLSSRSTEKLPGRGLGTPYHAHTEAACRMSEASWTNRKVSFIKFDIPVQWETCSLCSSGAPGSV